MGGHPGRVMQMGGQVEERSQERRKHVFAINASPRS